MKGILCSFFIYLVAIPPTVAQNDITDNVIGINHLMHSKSLNEDRQLQIYLPDDYKNTVKSYPVIYVLDGQRFFLHTVGLTASFRRYSFTPEFIVVGITNKYPDRFRHFGNGKDHFMQFMVEEVLTFVDNNYRTSGDNLLYGWEYGGGLVFNMMLDYPDHFNGYLLASPYPINSAIDKLKERPVLDKMLLFSVSPDEYEINHDLDKLDSLLTTHKIVGLNWTNLKLEAEEHRSTGYSTLYHGIRKYFEYYPKLEINYLLKFIEAGGITYALDYVQKRHELYGFDNELSLWSQFTIVRSAIRAQNHEYFVEFIKVFNKDGFLKKLINSRWSFGAEQVADFYSQNGSYAEAIKIYDLLLEQNPDSEKLLARKKNTIKKMEN